MDKARFVHIDESFFQPKKDLGKKFLNAGVLEIFFNKKERKITQEDIAVYAKEVLSICKKYLDNNPSLALVFLVHSMSLDSLFRQMGFASRMYYPDKDDFNKDTEIALNSLRSGLIEELKKQINSDEDFSVLRENKIFMARFNVLSSNQISEVSDFAGDKFYHKKLGLIDYEIVKELNSGRAEFLGEVQKDLDEGREVPNILLPDIASTGSTELLSPKIKLLTLDNLVDDIKKGDIKDEKQISALLKTGIKMVLDFAKGCKYIESKGFVLMDIDKWNIAYDLEKKQGVVFDLDGVVKIGEELGDRLYKGNVFTDDDKFRYGAKVDPGEMVFQLGVALKDLAELCPQYCFNSEIQELSLLPGIMTYFDTRTDQAREDSAEVQPSLQEVIETLEKIYNSLN